MEHVALSQSLRDMLLFKALAKEILKELGLNTKKIRVVTQSSVSEDNAGAIVVSSSPCLTHTCKFISVKYHWFCFHIDSDRNGSKSIYIDKIDGKVNPADIFTNSNNKESSFIYLRNL